MSLGGTISTPLLIVLNPAAKAIAFINIIIRTVVPKKSVFKIKRKNLSVYKLKEKIGLSMYLTATITGKKINSHNIPSFNTYQQ